MEKPMVSVFCRSTDFSAKGDITGKSFFTAQ